MMIQSFPKIFALGTVYIKKLFDDVVEITEKLDGSAWSIGKDYEGNFYMRSKGRQVFPETTDKLFSNAVEYSLSIQDKVPNDIILHFEYLSKPKHNILCYNDIPKNGLYLFGISDYSGTRFFDFPHIKNMAKQLDVDHANILFQGEYANIQQVSDLLNRESYLKGVNIEGIVIKNYNQQFLLGGQPMPLMCGKYVSEEFKEVSKHKWSKDNTIKGKWETFKDMFWTEARWLKAIQHLRENDELENDPKDIGKLIKEIQKDITVEEIDSIKSFLWQEFGGELLRHSIKGFPEFYKQYLMKQSFE